LESIRDVIIPGKLAASKTKTDNRPNRNLLFREVLKAFEL